MGFPGSGKTTIAKKLSKLLSDKGNKILLLDGDNIRKVLNNFDYSYSNRVKLAQIYLKLARKLSNQFDVTIISSIMLYAEIEKELINNKLIFPFIINKKFNSKKKNNLRKKYKKDTKNFYISKKIKKINNSNLATTIISIIREIKIHL